MMHEAYHVHCIVDNALGRSFIHGAWSAPRRTTLIIVRLAHDRKQGARTPARSPAIDELLYVASVCVVMAMREIGFTIFCILYHFLGCAYFTHKHITAHILTVFKKKKDS